MGELSTLKGVTRNTSAWRAILSSDSPKGSTWRKPQFGVLALVRSCKYRYRITKGAVIDNILKALILDQKKDWPPEKSGEDKWVRRRPRYKP
jgi:hypothetical protein